MVAEVPKLYLTVEAVDRLYVCCMFFEREDSVSQPQSFSSAFKGQRPLQR